MEIILKEDVIGLGEEGDIKNVAPGYARNYLLPRGFAIPKCKGNLKWLERQQKAIEIRKKEKAETAKGIAGNIDGAQVTISGKVASSDRLYGAIHPLQIAEALALQGFEVDHRKIELSHPLKNLGQYDITIKLYEGVQAIVKVKVVSSEDTDEESSGAEAAEEAAPATPIEENTAVETTEAVAAEEEVKEEVKEEEPAVTTAEAEVQETAETDEPEKTS